MSKQHFSTGTFDRKVVLKWFFSKNYFKIIKQLRFFIQSNLFESSQRELKTQIIAFQVDKKCLRLSSRIWRLTTLSFTSIFFRLLKSKQNVDDVIVATYKRFSSKIQLHDFFFKICPKQFYLTKFGKILVFGLSAFSYFHRLAAFDVRHGQINVAIQFACSLL